MKIQKPVYYGEYLQLDKILNAQAPESEKYGESAHDETLFIIIHQAYELWFKQIIHEITSVTELMKQNFLPSENLATIQHRLERVTKIQKILIDQMNVMETMTTLDFMEFRDYLVPASGFQSLQFRMIEASLGIKAEHRMEVEKQFFTSRLKEEDRKKLEKIENSVSIFELVEAWLERMPFPHKDNFNFWEQYSKAVEKMLSQDKEIISKNPSLSEQVREMELKNLEFAKMSFDSLIDKNIYDDFIKAGKVRLSHKAMLSAVFIYLYRDLPALQMPFRILNTLVEIDQNFTTWRYRHALMVQRILGTKIGTGGSSGHEYLKSTTERNRAFLDFFNLATYLIPKQMIPQLPKELKDQLDIAYDSFRS
ncbi:MAG TPA: tryptophan 2,3-dioxygenase family protein [Bacteriovoracaceae bacterium]|nr:tryptophan 2,3-dioxygenase family protein [Bacteriovoracaceae bacterium]